MNLYSKGHIEDSYINFTKSDSLPHASEKKELVKPNENKCDPAGIAFRKNTKLKGLYQLFTAVRCTSCTLPQ